MIIGSALDRLLDGMTVDLTIDNQNITRDVQFHYGDHKELLKWVHDRNSSNQAKYPLIWYVVSPYYEESNYKRVRSKLIIFQNTQIEWFNDTRSVLSYDEVIEPVWQKLKKTIELNQFISVIGNIPNKYIIKDEPNYGLSTDSIRLGQNDFSDISLKGEKGVTID